VAGAETGIDRGDSSVATGFASRAVEVACVTVNVPERGVNVAVSGGLAELEAEEAAGAKETAATGSPAFCMGNSERIFSCEALSGDVELSTHSRMTGESRT